jgi:hypothetical protein
MDTNTGTSTGGTDGQRKVVKVCITYIIVVHTYILY